MKKLQMAFIGLLLIAVGYAYKSLSEAEKSASPLPVSEQLSAVKAERAGAPAPVPVKDKKEFSDMIRKESESMSQLNSRPAEVQQRLRDLAEKVEDDFVPVLQEKALDVRLNGDERFLSVYILGESRLAKAQESLEQIAASPIPAMKESRMTTQEEIIRGHAIESLREPESIKRVLSQADNKFLTDRAQRTLSYREGKTKNSPEQQDQEALGKVMTK